MNSLISCQLCKSENLEKENNIFICTDCGFVLEENFYQHDEKNSWNINENNYCNINKLTLLMKKSLSNRITFSKKLGFQMLDYCMSTFNFTFEMKSEALITFKKLLNHEHFYFCSRTTKTLLAGVCIYLVLQKFDQVVTKNMIAKKMGCSVYDLGKVYLRVLKNTDIEKSQYFTINRFISFTLSKLAFEEIERIKIENVVTELINLQQKCCSIESKFPINVIYAASFYAWKFINLEERCDFTLKDYMRKFNLNCNLSRYVTKLIRFLIGLCNYIPWIVNKKRITNLTVFYYTNDLLEHSNTVVNDYLNYQNKLIKTKMVGQSNELEKKISQKEIELRIEKAQNIDLSETEIDGYIRSEEEVKILKKLYKKAKLN